MTTETLSPSWLILGAGVSGCAAYKLLKQDVSPVILSEEKDQHDGSRHPERREGSITLCDDQKTSVKIDGETIAVANPSSVDLSQFTDIVISPGFQHDHPVILAAKKHKLRLHNEIDLALKGYKGKIIGITGTNGKSTTCLMVEHILKGLGLPCVACGNVGLPPAAIKAEGELPPYLSIELSSYQLDLTTSLRVDIAVATSFSTDHIAHHGSEKNYFLAKWKLFECLKPQGLAIMTAEFYYAGLKFGVDFSPLKNLMIIHGKGAGGSLHDYNLSASSLMHQGKELFPIPTKTFPYAFDQMNYAMSASVARFISGKSMPEISRSAVTFKKPPHRMELCGWIDGEPVIDDSKSTNLESLAGALANFDRCILLLGGIKKEESFSPLQAYKNHIKLAMIFGRDREAIKDDLGAEVNLKVFTTLGKAMDDLPRVLGEFGPLPVLFSPGCASFDEFQNFEHRGQYFVERMGKFPHFKKNG
jgi:UDP-N-acetylmuramoylalanine--D-glutamate ligase